MTSWGGATLSPECPARTWGNRYAYCKNSFGGSRIVDAGILPVAAGN